jgi:hypothetical protein
MMHFHYLEQHWPKQMVKGPEVRKMLLSPKLFFAKYEILLRKEGKRVMKFQHMRKEH